MVDEPVPLTTTVEMKVPATLILHPEYGPDRVATDDDLRSMGYRHHQTMYQRLRYLLAKMGVDDPADDDRWNLLRYFVEYVTTYDHDMDDEDFTQFRSMIDSAAHPDDQDSD